MTLTAQQSQNNVVRVAFQALAAVLGGTQSLHTNGYDEALGLPTQESATLALRTQQIIANETGITNHVDPLGGSPLIEEITQRLVHKGKDVFDKIQSEGGSVEAVKKGIQTQMIHESAWKQQQELENMESSVVGVNVFTEEESNYPAGQKISDNTQEAQTVKLNLLKNQRDPVEVKQSLLIIAQSIENGSNLIDPIRRACKHKATLGEICGVLRENMGTWVAPGGI